MTGNDNHYDTPRLREIFEAKKVFDSTAAADSEVQRKVPKMNEQEPFYLIGKDGNEHHRGVMNLHELPKLIIFHKRYYELYALMSTGHEYQEIEQPYILG